MRYKIGRNPIYRVPIPALIGGINTNSSSDVVGDNQLSNCLNMMAMDGILRTRPGFVIDGNGAGIEDLPSKAKKIKKYDFVSESERLTGGGDAESPPRPVNTYGKIISVWCENGDIKFYHLDKNAGCYPIGTIETGGDIINEFTVASSDGLYSYVTGHPKNGSIFYKIYKNVYLKVGYEEADKTWEEVNEAYVPTIMTNCVSDGISGNVLNGDYLLGVNLLSNKYKIEVTAYNETLLKNWHSAEYKLPYNPPVGTSITVEITRSNGEVEKHSLEVTAQENGSVKDYILEEIKNKEFGIALVNGGTIVLYKDVHENGQPNSCRITDNILWVADEIKKKYEGKEVDEHTIEDEIRIAETYYTVLPGHNNIIITAQYEPDLVKRQHIFSATCNAWFGGNQGISSGTRLFIAGMEGEYKNMLHWSDLSNPLYFPENCFSKVGDPSQQIVGFGKQGEMLVVFKPFETYAVSYMMQEAPTEDAGYEFISDLTVTTAVFPLTQISGNVGCDCPGTIQLCRNRLCWVHSNGKAYTLVSSSQYNERNIYELSEPVKRALPNISQEELKNASSADWEGYYVLSAGEHIFLMQYESYGYSKIYSYTSEEAASHKLPWFYLNLPFKPEAVMSIENELVSASQNESYIIIHRAQRNAVKDENIRWIDGGYEVIEVDIPSMVQSKIFDFSRPELKKLICHILAEIGGTDGNSVSLSIISDRSRRSDFVENNYSVSPISQFNEYTQEGKRLITPIAETIERTVTIYEGGKTEEKWIEMLDSSSPDFFRIIRVNPAVFGIRKFAVHISSEGAFSLGQVCIEYKMLGSVK